MILMSDAFGENEAIPRDYSGQGLDQSPPLSWIGVPAATRSLVLICEDPDAPGGSWVHWVMYDILPEFHGLPEGVPKRPELWQGVKQGRNSFGEIGYNGP